MEKRCPECNELISGRSDKIYCNDYCRNAYNNQINKTRNNMFRNVHIRLRKNYRILEQFNPKNKSKISRKRLLDAGFSFDYITSIYKTKKGTVYYFVYNQGYLPLENDWFALVKRT